MVQDIVQQHAVVYTISGVETPHNGVILLNPFALLLNKRRLLHIANECKNVYGQRCEVTNSFSVHFVKYSPHTQVAAVDYICHEQLVCKMGWF